MTTSAEADQIIGNYQGWLYKTARELLDKPGADLDDLVQEGRLAMWLALDSFDESKGSLPYWLTTKARFRMLEVVQGRRQTGAPKRHHGRNAHAELSTVSLDKTVRFDGQGHGSVLADLVGERHDYTAEAIEEIMTRKEVIEAIRALTPAQQRYVVARFYEGKTGSEMIADGDFTYDPSALWTSQKNGARKKLAETLAYLVDVA